MRVVESVAALVELLLPGECAGCGAADTPWCPACLAGLGPPVRPYVPGVPALVAAGRYRGPLRSALLRYKERGRRDIAEPLADLVAGVLDELAVPPAPPGRVHWLVPAPSRPAAARQRGGDHVARLCHLVSRRRPGVRVARALTLSRGARDSVGLTAQGRAANLAGRVRVAPSLLPRPAPQDRVLLVDDVVTTGAMLRTCAGALRVAGVAVDGAIVLCSAA